MGQQQLLLLVLGIVIVGLAVVAGINAFDENQQKSSEDALTNEAFRLASDTKAWYNKPDAYQGGGSKEANITTANVTWDAIGVPATNLNSDSEYTTPWGTISKSVSSEAVVFTLNTNQESASFGTVTFDPSPTGDDKVIQFDRGGS